jgi:hypothetical protein
VRLGGNAINTLVSSGTGGTVLGIASANISPVININGNTVFSFYKFVECYWNYNTISQDKCYSSNCGKYYGKTQFRTATTGTGGYMFYGISTASTGTINIGVFME